MRLVLHVGLPKSGTTALQSRFSTLRRPLRRTAGVLYPKEFFNHNFLAGAVFDIDRMPRLFRQKYGNDNAAFKADFDSFWAAVMRSVHRHRPDTLLLSAESLASRYPDSAAASLSARLHGVADSIEAIAYVRRPSDYYLSSAQQLLKASHRLKTVRAIPYRAKLESIASVVDRMHVVAYDRSQFPGGDIAPDFFQRMIPAAANLLSAAPGVSANETMSAEIMAALQDYRRAIHPSDNNIHTSDTYAFIASLLKVEAALGGRQRPKLHDSVRGAIDHASPDLVWLRDTYGIAFSDIRYEQISAQDAWRPKRVDDVCPVDDDKKASLIFGAMKAGLGRRANRPTRFRTLPVPTGPAAGRVDAVLRRILPAPQKP